MGAPERREDGKHGKPGKRACEIAYREMETLVWTIVHEIGLNPSIYQRYARENS